MRFLKKINRNLKLRSIRKLPAHERGAARFKLEYGEKYKYGFASYGIPTIEDWEQGSTVEIGSFCSIAKNVLILLGGNHRLDWISTYPFTPMFHTKNPSMKDYNTTKGNVIIKNDVWIGMNSIILSGVTIGNGAVIAAGSVVTKDIPDYAVAAGNPARVIKYRFTQETIDLLLNTKRWEQNPSWIINNIDILESRNIELLKK